jgi:hypothetical protein
MMNDNLNILGILVFKCRLLIKFKKIKKIPLARSDMNCKFILIMHVFLFGYVFYFLQFKVKICEIVFHRFFFCLIGLFNPQRNVDWVKSWSNEPKIKLNNCQNCNFLHMCMLWHFIAMFNMRRCVKWLT